MNSFSLVYAQEAEDECDPVGRIVQTSSILCMGDNVDISAELEEGEVTVICFASRSEVEATSSVVTSSICSQLEECDDTTCFEARGGSIPLIAEVNGPTDITVAWSRIPGVDFYTVTVGVEDGEPVDIDIQDEGQNDLSVELVEFLALNQPVTSVEIAGFDSNLNPVVFGSVRFDQ